LISLILTYFNGLQISPEVHSLIAEQGHFGQSLIERLLDHYPPDSPFVVKLNENYRTNQSIIDFTSSLFYDNTLKAVVNPPRHKVYYPLTFFTARGQEKMLDVMKGFYNMAEASFCGYKIK